MVFLLLLCLPLVGCGGESEVHQEEAKAPKEVEKQVRAQVLNLKCRGIWV